MAIDSQGRWGPKTADDLWSWAQANFPTNRTTWITLEETVEAWQIITGDAQSEFASHQDIVLQLDDIHSKVDPGTFEDSITNAPIDGIGEGMSQPVTLQQRTQ